MPSGVKGETSTARGGAVATGCGQAVATGCGQAVATERMIGAERVVAAVVDAIKWVAVVYMTLDFLRWLVKYLARVCR